MKQNIQRLGNTRFRHILSFHNRFIRFRTADHIVRFDRQDLLQDMSGTEGLNCPDLHLSEALTAKLCLTS